MSLLDGLLRDPYRDPKNVWIALRADGQRGSGTIDDPYDGGSRLAPALAATLSFTASDVTGQTAEVHGYQPGDYVTIFGVTGTDAAAYNGSFPVSEVSASTALDQFFKYARAGSPTAGPSGTSVFVRKGRLFNIDLTSAPDPVPNLTVVTVDTAPENHGYANGDTVAIFGVTGAGAPFFNVNSTPITLTPGSSTEFKFTLTGLPAAAPAGSTIVCIRNSIGAPADPVPLLRVGLARQVTITTGAGHGYITGDRVVIAGAAHASLNGSFLITRVTDTSFTYITAYDPLVTTGGAVTCAKVVRRFDEVMRSLTAEGVSVHIGPGTFETRGFAGYDDPFPTTAFDWQPRSGWRLAGAGIGVTILKLVDAIPDAVALRQYLVVGNRATNFLMGFEAVNFTVDSNVAGQPKFAGRAFPLVVCGGIYVMGQHLRLRRLRCINFGTQSNRECFVLSGGTAMVTDPEAFDNVTEDCLVEQPGLNNAHVSSLIGMLSSLDPDSGRVAVHRACVVRDCFVDAAYVDRPVPILGMSAPSAGQVTVTTRGPHGRAAGDWVVISGALDEKGDPSASYNGSFLIPLTSVPGTYTFEITVTGNPTVVPGGQMFVGRAPSDQVEPGPDASRRLEPTLIGPSLYSVLLTSKTPHFRTPQNNVLVAGVRVGGSDINPYNGAFPIDEVVSTLELKYTTTYTGPNSVVLPKPDNAPGISFGVIFPGAGVSGGRSGVSERNRVFNSAFATNHDSFNSPDSTYRHCLFSGVLVGGFENLGSRGSPRAIGLSRDPLDPTAGKTATGITAVPHGLSPGDAVLIAKPSELPPPPLPLGYYYGYFVVQSVAPLPGETASRRFTYLMAGDPDANNPEATFAQLYHTQRLVFENNVIDLVPSSTDGSRGPSVGFWAGEDPKVFGKHPGIYLYRQLIVRENVIRQIESASATSQRTLAVTLASAEAALVDGNVIALDNPKPIEHNASLAVRPFNNVSPNGRAIPTLNLNTSLVDSELSTAVQDALLMAFL